MSIVSPTILVPTSEPSFRSSSTSQIISGTVLSTVTSVRYKYAITDENSGATPIYSDFLDAAISYTAVSYVVPEPLLPWAFDCSLLSEELGPGKLLYLEFYALNYNTDEISLPSSVTISFATVRTLPISSPVPSGITVEQSNVAIKVACAEVDLTGYSGSLLGYNFYVSTTTGGGSSGYSLMNQYYVTQSADTRTLTGALGTGTSFAGEVKITTTTEYNSTVNEYSYSFDGATLARLTSAGLIPSNVDSTTNFYFVLTTVLYDSTLNAVVESPFSAEITGRFLQFAAVYKEIPARNRDDISITMTQRVLSLNNKVNLVAGSVFRDILDPICEEFSDYYVIQDFLAQTESISGLMQFDDANGDGISDPVNSSIKKTRLRLALKLNSVDSVQQIIDAYFDKRAANYNITRKLPTTSAGKALLYATSVPPEGLYIYDGATLGTTATGSDPSIVFVNKGSHFISYEERATFYNTVTGRYELTITVESQSTGSLTNVAAGLISQVLSGADPRLKVTNNSPITGGTDRESNILLANRFQLAIAGNDTGTEGGYALKALSVGGVKSVRVEKAGDSLMMRDLDPTTNEHLGGKVDVYIQGSHVIEWQDTIAFSYSGPAGAGSADRFYVEDAVNFRVRTTNYSITASTPIFELIKVTNVTRSAEYSIAGAVVGLGDGDTLQLAQNSVNLSIGMASLDVIEADYRYRGSNLYTLGHQPAIAISSVTGDVDGLLPGSNYNLVKLEDPLREGNSTIASDGLELVFSNGLPSSSTRTVTGEAHYFLSTVPVQLAKKGVDVDTLVVSSDAAGLLYYQVDVDYTVGKGGDKDYTYIYLQPYSKIRSGSLVYLTYTHSQNFTVVYTVNETLQQVQTCLDNFKHATADVAVKGCVENFVDMSIKVIRKKGSSIESVSNSIKTTLGNYINNMKLGQTLMLDDVITMVKGVTGVKTVVLPVARMMKMNGSYIPSDYIGFANFRVYQQNTVQGVTSYISVSSVLNYGTVEGGGPSNLFRAIYENGVTLVLATTPLGVSAAAGRGFIMADGRILVSTTDGTPPQTKTYAASYYTYIVSEKEYSADIQVDTMENLSVTDGSITVDASAEEQITRQGR